MRQVDLAQERGLASVVCEDLWTGDTQIYRDKCILIACVPCGCPILWEPHTSSRGSERCDGM